MKRFVRYMLYYVAFFFASALVQAQAAGPTETLTITPSLTNTDGTAITSSLTCNLYQGIGPGNESTTPVQTGIACSTAVQVIVTGVDGANVCWKGTEVEGGVESAKSGEFCKQFPAPTPNAPGLTGQ